MSVPQNKSNSVTRSANRNKSRDWETELFTDISFSWPEYSSVTRLLCVSTLITLFAVNYKLEHRWGRRKVGTIKSKVREWTAREDLLVLCAFLLQGFSTAAWAAEKVPERNTGSANRHNGIKLTNKGRGPVRPRLKDCSMHTNRPPAPIQEPFPKHLQTHKGWLPTPTLQSAGPSENVVCLGVCVAIMEAVNKPRQDQKLATPLKSDLIWLILLL